MSFSRLFLIALFLCLASIGFTFGRIVAFPDSASWPLDKGERVTLLPGDRLTQTFTGTRDGLRQIEILFGKFTLEGRDRLTLLLLDSSCSSPMASKTLSRRSFDSEHTFTFIFDQREASRDKEYCLGLSYETDRAIAKDKAPRLFTDLSAKGDPFVIAKSEMQESGNAPIAIRPGYRDQSFLSTMSELIDRISQYKPFFLKDGYLATLFVLSLVLTIAVIVLLTREEPGREENQQNE